MKKRILVVDDDVELRQTLKEIFITAGYMTKTCESGGKALATIERTRPDLILLDMMIQGEDGFETCRKFKEDTRTANVPLFILSGYANISSKLHSFSCGARRYFTKPFEIAELIDAVGAELGISLNLFPRTTT